MILAIALPHRWFDRLPFAGIWEIGESFMDILLFELIFFPKSPVELVLLQRCCCQLLFGCAGECPGMRHQEPGLGTRQGVLAEIKRHCNTVLFLKRI